jgi:hypothetical protein
MIDELTPIAFYMAHEMNVNAHGRECREIALRNADSSTDCITEYIKAPWWRKLFGATQPQQCIDIQISSQQAALMMWAIKVMQNAEWDHKPKLRLKFPSPTSHTRVWHTYDSSQYYYDIWSNVHYGYVGKAAAFSDDVLLDGAGLEQIGTDILRRRWPTYTSGVSGLRKWDDDSDRAAISLGIELFDLVPSHVSAQALVSSILMTADLSVRPARSGT